MKQLLIGFSLLLLSNQTLAHSGHLGDMLGHVHLHDLAALAAVAVIAYFGYKKLVKVDVRQCDKD